MKKGYIKNYTIIKITAGGKHAWILHSKYGKIRKPLESLR